MANLPAEHAADIASLMARGNDPSATASPPENPSNNNSSWGAAQNGSSTLGAQNGSMSAIIDAYIVNLQRAGYVPNANATTATAKRDTALSLDPLVEKRAVPSVPLVIALLGQHGFVPANGTDATTDAAPSSSSKRDDVVPDRESALRKRVLPDIDLVVSRLAAHGFVPTGGGGGSNASSGAVVGKRDATGDINSVISQLEAYGFNPDDFMQAGNSTTMSSTNATSVSKRASHWAFKTS